MVPVSAELVLVLAALVAGAAMLVHRILRGHPEPAQAPPSRWNVDLELQRLVDSSPEMQALYERLTFSPQVERRSERLLQELKSSLRTEIPDYDAFRRALQQSENHFGRSPDAEDLDEATTNEKLLHQILAALGEPEKVIELMDRDPVDRLLPFVEQIPLHRGGEVIWRAPMEVKVIRKRPVDLPRFRELLDELATLVRGSKLRRKERAKEDALAAIFRLRRDLDRENAYLPTSIQLVEARVGEWARESHQRAATKKRKDLEDLLRRLLEIRYLYRERARSGAGLDEAESASYRQAIQAEARIYMEASWMHVPTLTTRILSELLTSELTVPGRKERRRFTSAMRLLRLVWEEVDSSNYDPLETTRRLREAEAGGLFVHSLIFALLRLQVAQPVPLDRSRPKDAFRLDFADGNRQ